MLEAVGVTFLFLILILLGTHLFIALGIAGAVGLYLFRGVDVLSLVITSFFGQATTFELLALPLFVLMGHVLAKSPIGADLFYLGSRWLSWLPGGLAIASIGACTVFGAVSGVSVAGVAAIGSMAVPEMIKQRLFDEDRRRVGGDGRGPGHADPAQRSFHHLQRHHRRIGGQALHRRASFPAWSWPSMLSLYVFVRVHDLSGTGAPLRRAEIYLAGTMGEPCARSGTRGC